MTTFESRRFAHTERAITADRVFTRSVLLSLAMTIARKEDVDPCVWAAKLFCTLPVFISMSSEDVPTHLRNEVRKLAADEAGAFAVELSSLFDEYYTTETEVGPVEPELLPPLTPEFLRVIHQDIRLPGSELVGPDNGSFC